MTGQSLPSIVSLDLPVIAGSHGTKGCMLSHSLLVTVRTALKEDPIILDTVWSAKNHIAAVIAYLRCILRLRGVSALPVKVSRQFEVILIPLESFGDRLIPAGKLTQPWESCWDAFGDREPAGFSSFGPRLLGTRSTEALADTSTPCTVTSPSNSSLDLIAQPSQTPLNSLSQNTPSP